jgi:hypothetical protein
VRRGATHPHRPWGAERTERRAPAADVLRITEPDEWAGPWIGRAQRRGAVLLEQVANLDEDLLLGRELLLGSFADARLGGLALLEVVHRQHEHEVDDCRDGDEVDERAHDGTDEERRAPPTGSEPRASTRSIADLEDHADQRVDEALDECVDDRRERGADDDSDREVDDVAAHDEVFEAFDHRVSSRSPACRLTIPTGEAFASDFDDVDDVLAPLRRSSCSSSRHRPRRTRVGAVEARTVEGHSDRAVLLAQHAAALGALGESGIAEGLDGIETVAALRAGVGVGGHVILDGAWCPQCRAGARAMVRWG